MRSTLLAGAALLALSVPAFAGDGGVVAAGALGVGLNGAYSSTGQFNFTNSTTVTNDKTVVVNPAEGSSAAGASFNLGAGNVAINSVVTPTGTVTTYSYGGQQQPSLWGQTKCDTCESYASATNSGSSYDQTTTISNLTKSITGYANEEQKFSSESHPAGWFDPGKSLSGSLTDNSNAGLTLTNNTTNQVTTNSNASNNSTAYTKGNAFATNSGTYDATGLGAAGLTETTTTKTESQSANLWSNAGSGDFGFVAGTANFGIAAAGGFGF